MLADWFSFGKCELGSMYSLFTDGGCGHCSLGSQFGCWEGEFVDVFIVLLLSNQVSFQVWWPQEVQDLTNLTKVAPLPCKTCED